MSPPTRRSPGLTSPGSDQTSPPQNRSAKNRNSLAAYWESRIYAGPHARLVGAEDRLIRLEARVAEMEKRIAFVEDQVVDLGGARWVGFDWEWRCASYEETYGEAER